MEPNLTTMDSSELMVPRILREYRRTRRESQHRFWSRFGVTQSRGSRFEMGTEIPTPIVILLKLYFEGIITDGDLWRAKEQGGAVAGGQGGAIPSVQMQG